MFCQGSFRLETKRIFFIKRVVNHWKRLSRGVVESPFLELLERCVTAVLRDSVWWWTG